jgi:HEAT repeat protein
MTIEPPPSEEGRYRAVRELALDGPDALAQLLARLSDESWRVRKAAVERLAEVRPVERALPHLVEALGNGDDAQARNAAAEALARIGAPAVRALGERLRHADGDVRKFAADILGEIGHADAVEPLARALDDTDRNVRAAAAEGLGKIGGPRAGVALERALKAEDHLLRVSALDGLARIGATPRTEVLEPLAKDRFLRRPVYRLLGRSDGERALELLLAGLSDPGRSTREAALAGISEQARRANGFFWGRLVLLARRALPGAEPMLKAAREALSREESAVVEGAVLVIGALGDLPSVVRLAELGGSERYRDAVRLALVSMRGEVVPALIAALPALAPQALALTSEIVGSANDAAIAAQALAALGQAPPELCAELLELLGRVAGPDSAEGLLARLDDPLFGEQARRALDRVASRWGSALLPQARALWAAERSPARLYLLGEVGEPADLSQVRGALNDSDPAMRLAAVRALAGRGVTDAHDALAGVLTDEVAEVRAAAIRALGRLQHPALETMVQTALRDASPRVAAAAAEVAGSARLRVLSADLVVLVERGGSHAALAALEALDRLERLEPVLLQRASEHTHGEVCRVALDLAAARAGGLELIELRLDHARWEVRRAAARVVGRVADASILGSLRERVAHDDDPLVIEALHQAISAIQARGH